MTKIRPNLFLGSQHDLTLPELEANGITAIVNVADNYETPEAVRAKYPTTKVELRDGGTPNPMWQFETALKAIRSLLCEENVVLVHCAGGRNRSPSVVAGYLVRVEGGTFEERWRELRSLREEVQDRAAIGFDISRWLSG
jgi:protein-tyrosine phosphatase